MCLGVSVGHSDVSMKNSQSPADFARMYREHGLEGAHVIKLGKGNDDAARQALQAWPGRSSARSYR